MSPRFLSSYSRDDGFAFASSTQDGFDEFFTGERVCPPHIVPRGSSWRRAWLVILTLGGAGWGWMQLPETMKAPVHDAVVPALSTLVAQLTTGHASQPAPAPAPEMAQTPTPPHMPAPLDTQEIAPAPGAEAGTQVSQDPATATVGDEGDTAAPSSEEAAGGEESKTAVVERLPPPTVDPADRDAARALAVGLHPDLSRVLLKKLTATDYANARKAITSALAGTPDDSTYIWPRGADRKHAQFEVRFVAGAPKDCRRYVVTIIKDRWSTTARAMEKCASGV